MADTVISPNNQQVRFRGRAEKEQAMPNLSEAQRGAMAAAAEGKSNLGISKKVGQEFMDSDKGGKLPKLHKRGLISDKALDAARAKSKKASAADDDVEGGPEIKPAKTGDAPKKGLALDDD